MLPIKSGKTDGALARMETQIKQPLPPNLSGGYK